MRGRLISLAVAVASLCGFGMAAVASAAEPPTTLWTRCAANSGEDVSCSIPRGIATNPRSGHVVVADQVNRRIVEFTSLGSFVKTWGWGVVESGPDDNGTGFEICVRSKGDICKAGTSGTGAGQLGVSQGVALDSAGNVYVVDWFNFRVQKFDPEGHFLLMFGDGVDQGPNHPGDLCTAQFIAEGDTCGAGVSGEAGEGQFLWPVAGSFIAIDPADKVYVGDKNRIQRFNTGGVYQGEIALPGKTVTGLATDAEGNLYATYNGEADVRKITPGGTELASPRFKVPSPTAVAVDRTSGDVYAFGPFKNENNFPIDPIFEFDFEAHQIANFGKGEYAGSTGLATNFCAGSPAPGNLYATNAVAAPNGFLRAYGPEPTTCGKAITGEATEIEETAATLNGKAKPEGETVTECFFEYGTTRSYGEIAPCAESSGEIGTGSEPVPVHAKVPAPELTGGTVYHLRLVVATASGKEAGSDKSFKTLGPPVISAEHVTSVAFTEATLKGLVNPEGFAGSYHFEYGSASADEHSTTPIPFAKDRSDHPAVANLTGLTPGTTYRWRIVAENEAELNGGLSEGEERTFTTFLEPASEGPCPNEALRSGAAALLPDCRAYEMVSPVDKNGGDILHQFEGYVQTSDDGERITYTAEPAFADAQASVLYNQYLAGRKEGEGWNTAGIHLPLGERTPLPGIQFGNQREFEAFSPELCSAWFQDNLEPALTPAGQDGYANIYRLDLCGEDAPEALTTVEPPTGTQSSYVNLFQGQSIAGYSSDASHALFPAKAALLPEARLLDSGSELQCATKASGTVTYKWLRNGAPIAGATTATRKTVAADKGKAIQCQVSATGEGAGSTQVANPAWVIAPAPATAPPVAPRTVPAPTQSAPLVVGGGGGQTLTCEAEGGGAWEGSPAFTYQWYRNGVAIGGATASTYLVTAGDLASAAVFQCAVTGTNAGGAVEIVSASRATSPEPNAKAPTVADASMPSNAQVYDRFGGALHLVSVLADGSAAAANSRVGSGSAYNLDNAVSGDGSLAYWTSGNDDATGKGKIFVRRHPEQGRVEGECTEAAKACTLPVSGGAQAFYWTAAADGSKALYSEEEGTFEGEPFENGLFVFDLKAAEEGKPARRLVAEHVKGVVGAADDLSRVYFVSSDELAPGAETGEPNLYLDEEGALTLVGVLVPGDVGKGEHEGEGRAYEVDSKFPYRRAARVSPDGRHLAFESRAQLTGFDNTDAVNGEADVEVFSYEAGGALNCVSCNPGGAQPSGPELREPYLRIRAGERETHVFASAWIQTWEHPLYASHVLSDNGNRLFFHSYEALVPRDTNGAMDVYEWEAPGEGSCTEGSHAFHAQNGGCVFLISTGESPFESEFWDASPDGRDVFFSTESSLVAKDPGNVDLYDARIDGGFAEPTQKAACEGEACQSPPAPPLDQTPASAGYRGPGNVPPPKARCPKGKHRVTRKGKARCVKAKKHKKHKRADHKRRAPR